jgi:hypothetical protein
MDTEEEINRAVWPGSTPMPFEKIRVLISLIPFEFPKVWEQGKKIRA